MRLLQTIFILLLSLTVSGQSKDTFIPFNSADYKPEKYQVKYNAYNFSKFTIEIRQVKLITNQSEASDFYCRAWVTISEGAKIIGQRYFKSIEAVGGCSGLFVPDVQPRNDYFMISKFGDYDGLIMIIDSTGKMTESFGGEFDISKDLRYLFSNYDSDAAGLTVYDLKEHKILFTSSDNVPKHLGNWYFSNGKYYAPSYDTNTSDNSSTIEIATFDFTTLKLTFSTVEKTHLKKEDQLKKYSEILTKNCDCGK